MEFHQMEEAAHKETERDELLKEITDLEKQVENHETQLVEIDQQQKQLLSNVRQETECLEQQRKNISGELLKEKDKMKFLENRMEELRKQHLISICYHNVSYVICHDIIITNSTLNLRMSYMSPFQFKIFLYRLKY